MALASILIVAFALLALWRAMLEPSLGWRFSLDEGGRPQATQVRGEAVLTGVRALIAEDGLRAPISPLALVESAGQHNDYSDHRIFFDEHRALWQILHQTRVGIEHDRGVEWAQPQGKDLLELGLRFWYPWLVSLLALSVGLMVWAHRPDDPAAWWYAAAALGYASGMLCTAGWGSRLLTQDPWLWPALHVFSHAGSFLVVIGLSMVLWRHPRPLGGALYPTVLLLVCGLSVLADALHGLPTIALTFRIPLVAVTAAMALVFVAQWRACRHDPLLRGQLKWLGLLLFASFSVVFVAYAMGAMGHVITLPQNFGLTIIALVFLGLVPLVGRIGLFRLERWWALAWLWFLGGLLVVVLDVLLLTLLPLSNENALMLALAIGGWLYFPLRQALWARLTRGSLPETRDLLPDVVQIATVSQADPARLNELWRQLWDHMFAPQQLQPTVHDGAVAIDGQGQSLRIPGWGRLQSLQLSLPERGRRLFNRRDVQRAEEILRLVRHGLQSQESYERGVREERLRIAADLHDDLGAKLLAIAHTQPSGPAATLARQAMDEMRLSLRDMASDGVVLADALADWRAETVSRLSAAGIAAQWLADEPPAGELVAARPIGQLTRVLREAVSNVIRHSGARHCQVCVRRTPQQLRLTVTDDGRGLGGEPRSSAGGHGLPNIERRVRKLGGDHRFHTPPGGGTTLTVEVPLALHRAGAAIR